MIYLALAMVQQTPAITLERPDDTIKGWIIYTFAGAIAILCGALVKMYTKSVADMNLAIQDTKAAKALSDQQLVAANSKVVELLQQNAALTAKLAVYEALHDRDSGKHA